MIETTENGTVTAYPPLRSFVARQRALGPDGDAKYDELFARFGIADDALAAASQSSDLRGCFPFVPNRLVIDVGFGMGDALVELAAARPDEAVVGFEVHRPGVFRTLRLLDADGIESVRVMACDFVEVLPRLRTRSVDEFRVFFPDPWLKRRQWNRRLLRDGVLREIERVLHPNGTLYVATDIEDYARFILEQAAIGDVLDAQRTQRPPWRPLTAFERKGMASGRAAIDIAVQPRQRAKW